MFTVNISEKEKAQILSEIEACDIGFDEGTARIDQDVNVSTEIDAEETVMIVQEVKAADKIKVLAVIDLIDSNNEPEETKIPSKSLNLNFKPVKTVSTNVCTDLKPYKCIKCNKSFKTNDSLSQHRRDKRHGYPYELQQGRA